MTPRTIAQRSEVEGIDEEVRPEARERALDLRSRGKDFAMRMAGVTGVGLDRLLGDRARGFVGILTYHRTAPLPSGLPKPLHNVTPDRLREQLSGLRRAGFRFWTVGRLLEAGLRRQPVPPRTVVVTFDDGYATLYGHAWPILRDLGVPATLFVCTAFLDQEGAFHFDAWGIAHANRAPAETYRPLTTAQCREMARSGVIELASHTHTHRDFRGRPEEFARDLASSLEVLEDQFGRRSVPFAFPYGSPHRGFASDELVAAAKAAGVSCAFTARSALVDPRSDPFGWGRFSVFPWDTSATLGAKLRGWYSWAPRAWQRLARGVRPLTAMVPRAS